MTFIYVILTLQHHGISQKNPKADVKNRFQKNIHFKKYSNKGKRMSKDSSDETPKPFLRVEREKHELSQESS